MKKASRANMTQMMLNRVHARSQNGNAVDEILMNIAQGADIPLELRFKAAAKLADLIFPKASSVEVKIEDEGAMNKEQIDNELKRLLGQFQVKQS